MERSTRRKTHASTAPWQSKCFALGAVLYEMLTGRKAFQGKSQASLISAILRDQPKSLAELQPLTPPGLDHVLQRCLAKHADERWQTAADLMRELQWIEEGGGRERPMETGGRRNPLPWTVGAAGVITSAFSLRWETPEAEAPTAVHHHTSGRNAVGRHRPASGCGDIA